MEAFICQSTELDNFTVYDESFFASGIARVIEQALFCKRNWTLVRTLLQEGKCMRRDWFALCCSCLSLCCHPFYVLTF